MITTIVKITIIISTSKITILIIISAITPSFISCRSEEGANITLLYESECTGQSVSVGPVTAGSNYTCIITATSSSYYTGIVRTSSYWTN